MKRPLSLFPARVFLDQPGRPVVRGMAVRRVRDGVVMFQAEGDPRQVLIREEYLLSAYDVALHGQQMPLVEQVGADPRGYAWNYVGDLPGTKKKPVMAAQKDLDSLVLRGVLAEAQGRYTLTEHGQRVRRVFQSLNNKEATA